MEKSFFPLTHFIFEIFKKLSDMDSDYFGDKLFFKLGSSFTMFTDENGDSGFRIVVSLIILIVRGILTLFYYFLFFYLFLLTILLMFLESMIRGWLGIRMQDEHWINRMK